MPSAALSAEPVPAQLYGRLISNARHMRPCDNGRPCRATLLNRARTGSLRPLEVIWVEGHTGSRSVQMGQSLTFFRIVRGGAPQISRR